MSDSPPPIDSSFDASDVATPCTVIARSALRNRTDEEENQENELENSRDCLDEEVSKMYLDDDSEVFGEDDGLHNTVKPLNFSQTTTKIYCYVDEQAVPYIVEVGVPPDCVTLGDVKRKFPKTSVKYYCIALEPESGIEVKFEISDDTRRLYPSKNGQFNLYLVTVEGSVHSDTSSGRHRKTSSAKGYRPTDYQRLAQQYDNSGISLDSEPLPTYVKKAQAFNRLQGVPKPPPPSLYDRHHPHMKSGSARHYQQPHHSHRPHHHNRHQNHYEDSTFDISESSEVYRDGETFYDEDDDDNRSINTDLTSVSQQHLKKKWRQQQQQQMEKEAQKRKNRKNMSTTSSSFSSISDSSMGIEFLTVRLNLNGLLIGMIPVGNKNAYGEGLYVGSITPGGAVALDGRIDVGDMITEINGQSLEYMSNHQAVEILKGAVQDQFVTLTVVKTDKRPVRNPRNEPTRPLDPNEWMKHGANAMTSIPEERDEWQSNSSAPSGTSFGGRHPTFQPLTTDTDKKYIVEVLAAPGSGLEIKDREWLKIPIPMSFLGQDLVDWLLDHIQGLTKRSKACSFAESMLKLGYIKHVIEKKNFSEKHYYVMGEECADYTQLRAPDGGFKYPQSQTSSTSGAPTNNNIFPPSMYPPTNRVSVVLPAPPVHQSMVSGYASMPASPFPPPPRNAGGSIGGSIGGSVGGSVRGHDCGRTRDDQRSQTSGSSRSSSRRYVELPKKTSSVGSGSVADSISENRVASRSSFRAAMSGSHHNFTIDM